MKNIDDSPYSQFFFGAFFFPKLGKLDLSLLGISKEIYITLGFLIALCNSIAGPSVAWPDDLNPKCGFVAEAMNDASRIRGLSVRRDVPCRLQNQDQIRRYILDSIEKKIPLEKLKGEETTFKLLGMIPFSFSYKQGLVDLYTSQLGGYFDPAGGYYAMADWMPESIQYPIAVHELTHALQDQHFHLQPILDDQSLSTDTQLALSALIEGDAMAVMMDYMRGIQGQERLAEMEDVSILVMQNVMGASLSLASSSVPHGLEVLLLFPYSSGVNFVHSLLRKGGYPAVDQGFTRLPRTSEEILHPEIYFAGKMDYQILNNQSQALLLKPLNLTPGASVYNDSVGEFFISSLLGSYVNPAEAVKASSGWGGDRLDLYRKPDGTSLLMWETRWDSEKDAEEFREVFFEATKKRLGIEQAKLVNHQFSLTGQEVWVRVVQDGQRVLVQIGEIHPVEKAVG